jgi:hypothetical protein
LTNSLNSFEALHKTTSLLEIIFVSLVLGFLPNRGFFCLIEKVPNFDNFNFFSCSILETIVDKKSSIRQKKSRIGRNPKTKESKIISSRDVVLFKPSKEIKDFVNLKDNG